MPLPAILLKFVPSKRILFTGTLSLVSLILFSVILGACTGPSPGIPDLYLFRIIDKDFEVRAAYFGICAGGPGRLACSANAGEFRNINDAPLQHREHLKMAMDARHTVFIPFFEAVATGLFLVAAPLMIYTQKTTMVTGATTYIDKAVVYFFGLASFVSFVGVVGVTYGRQGIALAAGHWSDGVTVEVGNPMLSMHCVVFGFCLILFLVNWLATFEGPIGRGSAWLFARNARSNEKE
jgi:Ca2+ regulator and membrane fusion protein Fig1